MALLSNIGGAFDLIRPSELSQVRRELDDAKITKAVLRTEYPLGYALLYVDGAGNVRDVQTAEAPNLTVDWNTVGLVDLTPDVIEVTWPHVSSTGPNGTPKATISGTPSVRLGLHPPGTATFQTPMLELWARVMMTEPRVVFVIGLKPAV